MAATRATWESSRMPTNPSGSVPASMYHNLRVTVNAALDRYTDDDPSKLMGRCCEASILAFRALKDAGYERVVMRNGEWMGHMDKAASSFFPFNKHSWVEVHVDGIGGIVVDPTQWVFEFDTAMPDTYVGPTSDERYTMPHGASFSVREWSDHYADWLAGCGFNVSELR